MADDGIVDEVEAAIRQAAAGQTVTRIRLLVGKEVSVPKAEIALALHKSFPRASVEMGVGKEGDAVMVRDIEVE